ncbi:MAG: primosomal protein N' [Deltaproteobacteria bacterium]|nr:primosomal protein N' [Deltaproteobacteria bacterium]
MIVDVAVPYRIHSTFHYLAEEEPNPGLQLGSLIEIELGKRTTHGFVLGFPKETSIKSDKLKPVLKVLAEEPVFNESDLRFFRWIADYYCHPIGEVIEAAIPRHCWKISNRGRAKASRLIEAADSQTAVGIPTTAVTAPELTEEQRNAVAKILEVAPGCTILLHGVTGSGKTEVYMAVVAECLRKNQGALILVPEISLTPQLLGRFSARFPRQVAVLHSDLTATERFVQWQRVKRGVARVVIGARSAIFAPVTNLGIVIVDEEQESSFKQEESVHYNARDLAVVRAQMEKAVAILGSATPSLESYANAKSSRYSYVTLKKRIHGRGMPSVTFVDMKERDNLYSQKIPWLSRLLVNKINEKISEGLQTALYLNRLGYAHFLFCSDCGHTWRCRDCDVALTYYRSPLSLKCHYCGAIRKPPQDCEECKGTSIETIGFGTEQVEKMLVQLFPTARIARMDRSVVKNRRALESLLNRIADKEIDILIGTQMIAKGHDFPGISLVGILMADASLNLPDFRSNERTFQIITQVSGRAGRAEHKGEVIIQSLNPAHPVLRAAAEMKAEQFYDSELQARSAFCFPPHTRVAVIRFQHRDAKKVEAFAYDAADFIRKAIVRANLRCDIQGPAEALLARVKKMYRWQCLLKAQSPKVLRYFLTLVIHRAQQLKSPVQMSVDVDPLNLL